MVEAHADEQDAIGWILLEVSEKRVYGGIAAQGAALEVEVAILLLSGCFNDFGILFLSGLYVVCGAGPAHPVALDVGSDEGDAYVGGWYWREVRQVVFRQGNGAVE